MAPDRSDKPLYQLGLYECLSSEETKCLKCSTDEKPKIIKTAKCSYSALVTHLKYHEVEQAKYHQLLQAGNTGQQPISAYVVNHIGSLTVLDRKILHLIAEATLPFNVVNHPTFRVLFGSTKHNESLKEEKHYRNVVLPKVYSYACQSIRALLGECEWLSFTCDIGSGPNDSFFALTAHGITRKWERKRYLLNVREFPGHHYGPLVKTMVDDLLKEWGIDEARVNCVVHDEGSNMEAAFAHTDMQDANCGAHQINLIVRSLWPNPKKNETASVVSILLTKCRNIVSEFRYSHIAAQQLVGYQKHHKLPEHHLVQDVTTRWDSTFLMLNRLLEQRAAIDGYYVNKKPDSMLSVADWALIQELHDLLKPFTMFNKALCRDTSPISMQVAMAKVTELELNAYKGTLLKAEVKKMLAVHKAKLNGIQLYKNHAVAHALDPRFRDTLFAGQDLAEFRSNVKAWIIESGVEVEEDLDAVRALVSSSPPRKKPNFMDSLRAKLVGSSTSSSSTSASQPIPQRGDLETEFDIYVREECVQDWDSDPLDWWAANAKRYPRVAPIARRFLSTPATSVACEQVFSTVKAVYDPRRSNLSAQKAEMLVFLNRNLPLLGYKY